MNGPRITIRTDFDFTPIGKRTARTVKLRNPTGGHVVRVRQYVGGRIYRQLPFTAGALAMTRAWIANAGAANCRPQAWESFQ